MTDHSSTINVLMTSAGRRAYLADWFRHALDRAGYSGRIVVADADVRAPALQRGDDAALLPSIDSPNYVESLLQTCDKYGVRLLFSLHDYDIARISADASDELRRRGIALGIPPRPTVDTVTDKLVMASYLGKSGFSTPFTTGALQEASFAEGAQWVTKHRFGSGSSGVFIVDGRHLEHAIVMSSLTAPDRSGKRNNEPDPNLVIVQEKIEGLEFGVDVVCDFEGRFQGVLARQKLRMRAGETDRAITADAGQFELVARKLASTLALRGTTDMDLIVTPGGEQYIIDINPRFGGGYPFVHMAGADIPSCYLAWALDRDIDSSWLRAEPGVVSSKYEAIHRTEG